MTEKEMKGKCNEKSGNERERKYRKMNAMLMKEKDIKR